MLQCCVALYDTVLLCYSVVRFCMLQCFVALYDTVLQGFVFYSVV